MLKVITARWWSLPQTSFSTERHLTTPPPPQMGFIKFMHWCLMFGFQELEVVGREYTCRAGQLDANKKKNRYPFILPCTSICIIIMYIQNRFNFSNEHNIGFYVCSNVLWLVDQMTTPVFSSLCWTPNCTLTTSMPTMCLWVYQPINYQSHSQITARSIH